MQKKSSGFGRRLTVTLVLFALLLSALLLQINALQHKSEQ